MNGVFRIEIEFILRNIENTMNCAYHIIDHIWFFFVFSDFGRNCVPKCDYRKEVFYV